MRFFMLIIATALCWHSSDAHLNAPDDPLPASLLGFMKPGMKLGIKSSQLDSLVTIEIYNEDQFQLAMDVRDMEFQNLEQKYPQIREKAASTLAEYKSEYAKLYEKLGRPIPGEPAIRIKVDRGLLLCTVTHVGEDYLLVSSATGSPKKQAISKQAVARIRWASDDVEFESSLKSPEGQK